MAEVLNLEVWQNSEHLASQIASTFTRWKTARAPAEAEWTELRRFLFATDTRSTSTGNLGHSNSTTLPKLTQIRDNLHANYMAALFPNDNYLTWDGADRDAVALETRNKITGYMKNRLASSGFQATVSDLLYDFIDSGNPIASSEYVTEYERDATGNKVVSYAGPKAIRISPFDIVFDPTAVSFNKASKITRRVTTLGQLEKEGRNSKALAYQLEIVQYLKDRRTKYTTLTKRDQRKLEGIVVDGFGSYQQYITSGLVEVLEFEGTLYNLETQDLLEDVTITIVDRTHVIRNIPSVSFMVHTGWRKRPDNLWAMSPLANLVGMQYRIDHLENLRADIFDDIAHPTKVVYGDVPIQGDIQPGQTLYAGAEGRIDYLRPDATALQADFQIDKLEQRMELYAGAPREAMGVRSPGEKTAFEVQQLTTAASRIFQEKITQFEVEILEPLINEMFRLAKAHAPVDGSLEKIVDANTSVADFINIKPEDLLATGKLRPKGARHFAAVAKLVQDLNNLMGSPLGQDDSVKVHFSGKEMARLMNDQLDLAQYKLFGENIRISENMETSRLMQTAQQQLQKESQMDAGDIGDLEQ